MPQFYIKPASIKDGTVLLDAKETRHALSVLRVKSGQVVDLFDGAGKRYRGIVAGLKEDRLQVTISENVPTASPKGARISLAISVIKPERMELLVEKCSELGVARILPLITDRCVVKLSPERWASKVERWRKIALQSCKQCGRSETPEIADVRRFSDFIKNLKDYDTIFIPTLAFPGTRLLNLFAAAKPQHALAFIGPEGDFTKKEIEDAISMGAKPADLGPLVLRSETAAIFMVSAMNFFYQEELYEKK